VNLISISHPTQNEEDGEEEGKGRRRGEERTVRFLGFRVRSRQIRYAESA
jgi:hypothetical protein